MFSFLGLDVLHFGVAYGGLVLHVLMILAERPGSLLGSITKKDILTTSASVIAIPILLTVCTDTSLKELLPINYLTAFLSGYQTQSILRYMVSISGRVSTPKSTS